MSKPIIVASATLAVIVSLTVRIWAGPSAASPSTLEVPLPGLIGFYDDTYPPISAQFSVTINPAAILWVSVRLRGNLPWPSYTTSCGYNGIIFSLDVPAMTGAWETEFYVDKRWDFDVVRPLFATGGATWDFLVGGKGNIRDINCSGAPRPLPPGCAYIHGGCCPIGEVTYASIIFYYDPTVPVETTTWGRIKDCIGRLSGGYLTA